MTQNPRSKRPLSIMSPPAPPTEYVRQFQWITALGASFHESVQRPIALRQTLIKNSEHPRCIEHNIVLSIYCTFCRRALCASCMYGTGQHRKHRVIPLNNAGDCLREDIRALGEKIPSMVKECVHNVNETSNHFLRIERDFGPMAHRIRVFYENLRTFIKMKEFEQLQMIRQRRELIRSEVMTFYKQLDSMHVYISEKFKTYGKENADADLLVPFRSVLDHLLQAYPFIKMPKFQTQTLSFAIDQGQIQKIYGEITFKISSIVPPFQQIRKNRVPQSARSAPSANQELTHKFFKSTTKFNPKEKYIKKTLNTTVMGSKSNKRSIQ